jgi:hypothetical protein
MAENFPPRSLDRAVVWVYVLEQKSKRIFIAVAEYVDAFVDKTTTPNP